MSSFSEIPSASAFTGAVVLVFNLQLSLSCYLSSRDQHSKKCETNTNHCWAAMDVPCLHVLQSQRIPPQLTRKVIKSSSQAHISGWNVLYPTPLETLACSYIWQMSSIARLLSWFWMAKDVSFRKKLGFLQNLFLCFSWDGICSIHCSMGFFFQPNKGFVQENFRIQLRLQHLAGF